MTTENKLKTKFDVDGHTLFKKISIFGDGNCLFRSASEFQYGHERRHLDLRLRTVNHIKRKWDEFNKFLPIQENVDNTCEEYCYRMSKSGEYGTSLECLALSQVLTVRIAVFITPSMDSTYCEQQPLLFGWGKNYHDLLTLHFSGNINEGHFLLLKPEMFKCDIHSDSKTKFNQGNTNTIERNPLSQNLEKRSPDEKNIESSPSTNNKLNKTKITKVNTNIKPTVRRKWTEEMNRDIFKIFLKVTKFETDLTSYRNQLHREFIRSYPELSHLSVQRVADQLRCIRKKNLLPKPILDEIRQEMTIKETIIEQQLVCNTVNNSDENETKNKSDNITEIFESMMFKYGEVDMSLRPKIPRLHTSKKLFHAIDKLNNDILPRALESARDLLNTNSILYCAALTVAVVSGSKVKSSDHRYESYQPKQPPWLLRLQNKIDSIRKDLAHIDQYSHGTRSEKILKSMKTIFQKYEHHCDKNIKNYSILEIRDTARQKLSVLSKRLRRYKTCVRRRSENKLFARDEKRFYRQFEHNTNENKVEPSTHEIHNFWNNILGQGGEHKKDAVWIQNIKKKQTKTSEMKFININENDVFQMLTKSQNWKKPGCDQIQNFWLKKFTSAHKLLAQQLCEIIQNPSEMPDFLCKGVTILLPKSNKINDPSQYRPITCLPTMYKLMTGCIAEKIYEHCTRNEILNEAQKGCGKNTMGSKEQLIIDSVITGQAIKQHRNIHMAYIDYKKAYDSVPHSWLLEILRIYKVNGTIIQFLEHAMSKWETELNIGTQPILHPIKIRRGIFQGDSLSPLWFCLALNPLSDILNDTKYGYKLTRNTSVTHLLYLDDLKIYSNTKHHLKMLLECVTSFSQDIRMSFGLKKCRKLHIEKGKIVEPDDFILENVKIESLEKDEAYKYLGIAQNKRIATTQVKNTLKESFGQRLII